MTDTSTSAPDHLEIAPSSSASRPPFAGGSASGRSSRSRISNGSEILPGVDGRSAIARRYRDIASAVASDQGGAGHLSEARQQLIRRFAAASCLAEQLEARLASGEQIDIGEHSLLVSTAVRVAQRIGIDRRARNVTPTLSDYIEAASPRRDDGDGDGLDDDDAEASP